MPLQTTAIPVTTSVMAQASPLDLIAVITRLQCLLSLGAVGFRPACLVQGFRVGEKIVECSQGVIDLAAAATVD